MRPLILLLVFIAGAGIPIQSAVNSRLRVEVLSPGLSALISFIVGALVLIIVNVTGLLGRGRIPNFAHVPWWAWTGGIYGALVVTAAIVGVPKIGTAGVVGGMVAGQLVASILVDQLGAFGVPRFPINVPRAAGAVMLLVGTLLIMRK